MTRGGSKRAGAIRMGLQSAQAATHVRAEITPFVPEVAYKQGVLDYARPIGTGASWSRQGEGWPTTEPMSDAPAIHRPTSGLRPGNCRADRI